MSRSPKVQMGAKKLVRLGERKSEQKESLRRKKVLQNWNQLHEEEAKVLPLPIS